MKIKEMLDRLYRLGKNKSFSEEFLISEFGQEGFDRLWRLGLIECGYSLMDAEAYLRELQYISPPKLADFRRRIRAKAEPEKLVLFDSGVSALPLVYYQEGASCISGFSLKLKPFSKLRQKAVYVTTSNPEYDNVKGYKLESGLVVLRYFCDGYFPDNCRILAENFGGRIPQAKELLEIIANCERISKTAQTIDEDLLHKGYYLTADKPENNKFTVINIEDGQDCKQIPKDEKCCCVFVC